MNAGHSYKAYSKLFTEFYYLEENQPETRKCLYFLIIVQKYPYLVLHNTKHLKEVNLPKQVVSDVRSESLN